MSAYSEQKTEFRDVSLLIETLAECGYTVVENHDEAQTLVDYHGHPRPEKANVIVRRRYIGSAANDIGFVKRADGTYGAIISEYDSYRHNARWMNNLRTIYAEKGAMKTASRIGLRFVGRKVVNGKIKLQFVKS